MAALSYVFPPLSGLFFYFTTKSERVRFHAVQAVAIGVLWPALAYVATWIGPSATQVVFFLGAAVWLLFLVLTAVGANPRLPLLGRGISLAAQRPPH